MTPSEFEQKKEQIKQQARESLTFRMFPRLLVDHDFDKGIDNYSQAENGEKYINFWLKFFEDEKEFITKASKEIEDFNAILEKHGVLDKK